MIAILPILALTAAGAAAPAPPPSVLRSIVDRVAATVNGDVITLRELEGAAGSALSDADLLPPGPERDKARAEALRAAFDLLVADRLFKQQVKKLDLEVSEAQVDAQVESIKEQNHFDDLQLEQALMSQGLTRATFRERVRAQLQDFAVLQFKVGGRVKVSDQELESYYRSHPQEFSGEDEIRVRHIFLPLSENAPGSEVRRVEEEAGRALERLRSGEDFAKVAQEVSHGPSADSGGDLGWLRRGTIQKTLEEAIFSLRDGQISAPVRAGAGVHILKAEARRKGGGKSFAEVKESIRDHLVNEQAESYRTQYVAELRHEALIETRLPELK
ncbi:MAG TPA: peptidylprolyl isomerase [Anaeromyxobacter sp.]|nr:peptidylprolyl isomerase [Anaeromyxobacter sp.]